MNVFATVKTSINTREAAARYGVEVNHHGKALCPFHDDRHPSLFVDDDHYHCYACGEHGDVIDFTSKLYGLSMLDAAKKLAYDFGITQDKPPIRPENQRLIAVSIDGEVSSPSVAQAKRLHELDKEGKLNGDVIDGILSEEKKEDRGVIISTAELSKYFGKEVTPAKMKEQIMALLDEWKEKQPPELAKPDKKKDLEK